jgi:hypothetical protein
MSLISKNVLQIESIVGVIGVIKEKKATISGGLSFGRQRMIEEFA